MTRINCRRMAAAVVMLGLFGTALKGQAVPAGVVAGGTLSFDGRATAGAFTGTTTSLRGEMSAAPDLAGVRGWVEAPVASLKTGNDHRDADMLKSMEAGRYPTIRYELDDVTPGPSEGDTTAVILHGRFIIHGVTRTADLTGKVERLDREVRLQTQAVLNLKDYRIGGLSKMLGLLKMHELITVHVDVSFGTSASEDVSANME